MKTLVFAPLEPIPSITTISKLCLCDTIVFADNMPFNKRHHYNVIKIDADNDFTFPIKKTSSAYRSAIFDKQQQHQEKLTHIIRRQFKHYDYAIFFMDKLIEIIRKEKSLFNLHQSILKWLFEIFELSIRVEYDSDRQNSFDLKSSIERFPSYSVLLDKQYVDFANQLNLEFQIYRFTLKQFETYPYKISDQLSFLHLLFEFGPYVKQLFSIDNKS